LALSSGLRVSEVAGLELSNINFTTREITIIGKGSKERTTFFSVKAKMLLEKYLKTRKEFKHHENVFLAIKFPHQPIKSRALQLILDKIKKRAGLENVDFITFHNLRKKCFTDGLSRGLTIAQVQAMAGHSDPSTTINSYIQLNLENLRSDYNKAML
jgi:integrase/recombinase XerD